MHALAARYPDGKIHFLAIQGHPEVSCPVPTSPCSRRPTDVSRRQQFTPSIVEKMVALRSSTGLFTTEMTVEAQRRLVLPNEGRTTFGVRMWGVLLKEI